MQPSVRPRKRTGKSFKQQRLAAWQPLLTPFTVIPSFFVIGLIFVPIGAILLVTSNEVVETDSIRYDKDASSTLCPSVPMNCTVALVVEKKMKSPVYFYYELTNFHQNHRRYVRSRDNKQLSGDKITEYKKLGDCDPLRTQNQEEDDSKILVPCGLVANSFFTDKFKLMKDGQGVNWRKKGIAWESDLRKKFKDPGDEYRNSHVAAPGVTNFEDEDFVVWMRAAGLPSFRKLYRIIDMDLEPGTYYLEIESVYDVSSWSGSKQVILSTTTWMGGRNLFLGWGYIVVGSICLFAALAFIVLHKVYPRSLGDPHLVAFDTTQNPR